MNDWRLHARSREVEIAGARTRISEKPFRILMALVEAQGEVVTRADLQARLWSDDTFVDFENNLNSAVASLRHVFGDAAKQPTYIETIPKVGYRLKVLPTTGPTTALVVGSPGRRPVSPWATAAIIAALVVGTGAVAWRMTSVWESTHFLARAADPAVDREIQSLVDRGRYLRGQYESTHKSPEMLDQALAAFVDAGHRSPQFADAFAEEAETSVAMSFAGSVSFRDGLAQAREAARRTLALAPDHHVATRVMAVTTLFLDWDTEGSRAWLDRSAPADNDAKTAMVWAMWFAATGQADAAVDAAEQAVELDPAAYFVRADLAMFYLVAGRNTDAVRAAREVLAVAPDFTPARGYALLAHERLGEWEKAAEQARALMRAGQASSEALELADHARARDAVTLWRQWDLDRLEARASGRRSEFALDLALRHAAMGDRATALAELTEALASGSTMLIFLRSYPELAPLQGDPAFEAILRRVGRRG